MAAAAPATTVSPIEARLTALEQTVAALQRAVVELRSRRRPVDAALDARRLSALARSIGSAVFTAADVMRLARRDAELRDAVGDATARQIGAWLSRCRRTPVGPYRLIRVGRDDRGALWSLAVSDDRHTDRGIPHRPSAG